MESNETIYPKKHDIFSVIFQRFNLKTSRNSIRSINPFKVINFSTTKLNILDIKADNRHVC